MCFTITLRKYEFGLVSLLAIYTVFLLLPIMFPTIFAFGIIDLGPQTKKGASVILMAVVGGAVFPPLMGHISDRYSMSMVFLLQFRCLFYFVFMRSRGIM